MKYEKLENILKNRREKCSIYFENHRLVYDLIYDESNKEIFFENHKDNNKGESSYLSEEEFLDLIKSEIPEEKISFYPVSTYGDFDPKEDSKYYMAVFVPETKTIVILSKYRYYYINRSMDNVIRFYNLKIYRELVLMYNKLLHNTTTYQTSDLRAILQKFKTAIALPNKIGEFCLTNYSEEQVLENKTIEVDDITSTRLRPLAKISNHIQSRGIENTLNNFSFLYAANQIIEVLLDEGEKTFYKIRPSKINLWGMCIDYLIILYNTDIVEKLTKEISANGLRIILLPQAELDAFIDLTDRSETSEYEQVVSNMYKINSKYNVKDIGVFKQKVYTYYYLKNISKIPNSASNAIEIETYFKTLQEGSQYVQ